MRNQNNYVSNIKLEKKAFFYNYFLNIDFEHVVTDFAAFFWIKILVLQIDFIAAQYLILIAVATCFKIIFTAVTFI